VTTVCTWETRELTATALNASPPEMLSLFDNVIGMQLEEAGDTLYPVMKVIKIRDSAFAPAVTKLIIPDAIYGTLGERGIVTSGTPEN
jgi:circadian clock protein KaiC